jgi:hypothetical protein
MNARSANSQAVPPKLRRAGWSPSAFFSGAVLLLVALGGGLVVYTFDPSQTSFYPGCAFHRLTGLNCPGCGSTRAVYALLHGRWLVALHDNALFIATLVALMIRAGWLLVRRWRNLPPASLMPTRGLLPWLVIAVVFGVVRNFPAFAFLSP